MAAGTAAYTLQKLCAAVFILERKKLELLMSVVLILCACILAGKGWERASGGSVTEGKPEKTVIVDAGHGGGKNGWEERTA